MTRGSLVHVVLLVITLIAAWRTWTRPQAAPKTDSSVKIWEASAKDVQVVEFLSDKRHAKIERKQDAEGDYLWVTVEKEPRRPPGPMPVPATEETERTKNAFVGGKSSEQILEMLASPTAVRALGKLDAGRKKDLGLNEPEARITVRVGKQGRELHLGSKVYGGSERYVLDAKSGETFVLEGATLRNMEVGDTSLMLRELHEFGVEEIRRAKLTAGDKSREFVRLEGSAKANEWAAADTPTEKDETVSTWMSRIAQLRALEYLADDAGVEALNSGGSAPVEVLRVELTGEGDKKLGFLEMFRLDGGEKSEYHAQTEITRLRVKISQRLGDSLEGDLASLLSP